MPESVTQAAPGLRKSDLVSIGVLDNQPLQRLRFARHDAKANWPSVVLRVKTEAVKTLLLEEVLGNFCQFVEGIGKLRRIGSIAAAKAWIVCGDDVKAFAKGWNEIAILMRRGREAVQQNKFRTAGPSSLTISNVEAVDGESFIPDRAGIDRGCKVILHRFSFVMEC